jgi:hypothetical protein
MKPMLSGVSEIYKAFKSNKLSKNQDLMPIVDVVLSRFSESGDSLGFAKRAKVSLDIVVSEILEEENISLSKEKFDVLIRYIKARREDEIIRNRFWVQLIVTLVMIVACFYLLLSGNADQNSQKVIFGLLGTVLGYWLR